MCEHHRRGFIQLPCATDGLTDVMWEEANYSFYEITSALLTGGPPNMTRLGSKTDANRGNARKSTLAKNAIGKKMSLPNNKYKSIISSNSQHTSKSGKQPILPCLMPYSITELPIEVGETYSSLWQIMNSIMSQSNFR